MGRVPFASASLAFVVAFFWCPSPAGADPVRVTEGFVDSGGEGVGRWDAEDLQLTGPGWHISSSLEDVVAFVQLATLPTVAPGALVDLSGVLRVEDVVGAMLDDSFGLITAPFAMSFTASPTRLACSNAASLLECTGVAPFTFNAELTFAPEGGLPQPLRLIGSGRAEVRLERSGSLQSGGVRYVFEASPVPEPATLSLFTTGVIAVGARAWRRRGRRPAA